MLLAEHGSDGAKDAVRPLGLILLPPTRLLLLLLLLLRLHLDLVLLGDHLLDPVGDSLTNLQSGLLNDAHLLPCRLDLLGVRNELANLVTLLRQEVGHELADSTTILPLIRHPLRDLGTAQEMIVKQIANEKSIPQRDPWRPCC